MNIRHLVFNQVTSLAARFDVFVTREPLTQQQHLKQLLGQEGINCVLDVGAFVGDYALALRSLGYKGRVISFEPFPGSFAAMRAKLQNDASWTGQPYGLTDESRTAELLINERGDFNSMLSLKDETKRAYQLNDSNKSSQINLRRLDEVLLPLLGDINPPRIFLKIDTQGHDLEVLRGASGVKQWIVGIQSELPAVPLYDNMHSMSEMIEAYRTEGFVPVGFYPVNTLRDSHISPEFDVFFRPFGGELTSAP